LLERIEDIKDIESDAGQKQLAEIISELRQKSTSTDAESG